MILYLVINSLSLLVIKEEVRNMSFGREKKEGEVDIRCATIKNLIDIHEISGKYGRGILHVFELFGKSDAANLLSLDLEDGNVVEINSDAGEITCRVVKKKDIKDE